MKRAFTLIELLVVIAIIAILSAILFPVFATAREKARQTACLSNLKQIGLAFTQYEQDYDEFVPCGNELWGIEGWAGRIYPYVKSTQVFLCPNDAGPGDIISYAANANLVTYNTSTGALTPIEVSQMNSPCNTVLLFEVINCNSSGISPTWTVNGGDWGYSPGGYGLDKPAGKLLQGANSGNGTTCSTCMKLATGILAYSCVAGVTSPCDVTGTTITPTNSYYPVTTGALGVHSSGSNFLLADDHAKWFPPSKVGAGYDNSVDFTAAHCPGSAVWQAPTTSCTNPIAYPATFAYH